MTLVKKISAGVAVALTCTFLPQGASAANLQIDTPINVKNSLETGLGYGLTDEEKIQSFESLLEYYESIPEEVLLEGDDALEKWMSENPNAMLRASVTGCVGSILWLFGSNVVGAAKILKIKQYMKSLGGVKEAVQLMWGASFSYEKMLAAGGALAGLGAELIGIDGLQQHCFEK